MSLGLGFLNKGLAKSRIDHSIPLHKIRIEVARNTLRVVWEMSDRLEVIRREVEARETSIGVKTNATLEKVFPNHHKTPTANALLSQDGTLLSPKGNQVKCVHFGGAHFSASCETVSDPRAGLEILRRDGRCFPWRFKNGSSK